MSYSHTEWYLPFFARRNSLTFEPKFRLSKSNQTKLNLLLSAGVPTAVCVPANAVPVLLPGTHHHPAALPPVSCRQRDSPHHLRPGGYTLPQRWLSHQVSYPTPMLAFS